jgi:hypothetical protein
MVRQLVSSYRFDIFATTLPGVGALFVTAIWVRPNPGTAGLDQGKSNVTTAFTGGTPGLQEACISATAALNPGAVLS